MIFCLPSVNNRLRDFSVCSNFMPWQESVKVRLPPRTTSQEADYHSRMFTSPQFAVSGISVTNNMADEVNSPMQFSSGEKEVIERKLNVRTEGAGTKKDINDFYEISRCVDVVKRGNFQKVRS